jgi:hypothetical protein
MALGNISIFELVAFNNKALPIVYQFRRAAQYVRPTNLVRTGAQRVTICGDSGRLWQAGAVGNRSSGSVGKVALYP